MVRKFYKNGFSFMGQKSRPNLAEAGILQNVFKIGSQLTGRSISSKIATETDVIKIMSQRFWRNLELSGSFELTKGLVRGVLNNMDWVKKNQTTGKVELYPIIWL